MNSIIVLYVLIILTAYDFLNSNVNNFKVSTWYNSTYKGDGEGKSFSNIAGSFLT